MQVILVIFNVYVPFLLGLSPLSIMWHIKWRETRSTSTNPPIGAVIGGALGRVAVIVILIIGKSRRVKSEGLDFSPYILSVCNGCVLRLLVHFYLLPTLTSQSPYLLPILILIPITDTN